MCKQLPTWLEANEAIENGEETALDVLIHDNSPAGTEEEEKFRKQVWDVIGPLTQQRDELVAMLRKLEDGFESGNITQEHYDAFTSLLEKYQGLEL